jgi:hypothetical protein
LNGETRVAKNIFETKREKEKMEDVENDFREMKVNKLKQNANNRGK